MTSLSPGTLVYGRYHIVQQIGQGGFGTVYEAIDGRLGRRVALKQLLRKGDRISRQFEREAQLLANLSHPMLPRVTDHFSDADGQFLVMDYISGPDLMAVLLQRDAPFPVEQVIEWGIMLLDVLQYLHSQQPPIIHRDIKPQNLKLQADGTIMLLDFGLAKGYVGNVASPTTESSFLAYTKGYAPPEQVENQGTDARSDIYSLAGTLHCLLTNTGPMEAQMRLLAAERMKKDPLRPTHELNPDVPEAVSAVIMQALALKPEQRPPSAEAMRTMLIRGRGSITAPLPAMAPAGNQAPKTEIEESAILTSLLGLHAQPATPPTAAPSQPIPPTAAPSQPIPPTAAPSQPTPPAAQPSMPSATVEAAWPSTPTPPKSQRWRLPRPMLVGRVVGGVLAAVLALLALPALRSFGHINLFPTPTPPTATVAPTAGPLTPAEIAEKLRPSTVIIHADFPETVVSDSGTGWGTGIVYNDKGHILTNAHVIEGASSIIVKFSKDDQPRHARLIGHSSCDDLAILQIDNTEGLKPATIGKSSELKIGDPIVTLGYPLEPELAATRGIVSRVNTSRDNYESLIQIDATINPGNSGGPLVDQYGQVVGINTLRYNAEVAGNTGFAISMDQAGTVIKGLQDGHNPYWTGMNLVQNEYADYFGLEGGLVVAARDNRSPAAAIGIEPADLLLKLAGSEVNSLGDVCKILRSHSDGDALGVDLLRVTETKAQLLSGSIIVGKYMPDEPRLQVIKELALGDATPTEPASDSTAKYSDDFSEDRGDWSTVNSAGMVAGIHEGAYFVGIKEGYSYFLSPSLAVGPAADMAMAVDVYVEGNARAGVAVRYSESGDTRNYYACWVDGQHQYGCFVSVGDQWTTLAEATVSDAIRPGEVNRVILAAEGGTVSLLINDQEVAQFANSALATGIPALYVENFDTVAGAGFDNVVVVTSNQ